jgi:hypothetical protein
MPAIPKVAVCGKWHGRRCRIIQRYRSGCPENLGEGVCTGSAPGASTLNDIATPVNGSASLYYSLRDPHHNSSLATLTLTQVFHEVDGVIQRVHRQLEAAKLAHPPYERFNAGFVERLRKDHDFAH